MIKDDEGLSAHLHYLYPHGHKKFIDACIDEMDLHSRKNYDYASGGHSLGNFYRVSKMLALYPGLRLNDPSVITVVYMMKQLDAVLWMKSNGHIAKVEGSKSRLRDISVYVKLIQILDEETQVMDEFHNMEELDADPAG